MEAYNYFVVGLGFCSVIDLLEFLVGWLVNVLHAFSEQS
jgi:uncharacterized membrane protein YqaE (UPF0057 family)